MKLLQNEVKLFSSNEDKIILTDDRIMMRDEVAGKAYKISIFLEDISSIEVQYKSNTSLLIIATVLALASLVIMSGKGGGQTAVVGLVIAGFFITIWWITRKHLMTISSNGGSSLNFLVQGMSDDEIEDFITTVQAAKLKRVNQLFKL